MKKKELVSIVINCHNGEKYLSKTLYSVLSQTYNNFEVIFLIIVLLTEVQKYLNHFKIADLDTLKQKKS